MAAEGAGPGSDGERPSRPDVVRDDALRLARLARPLTIAAGRFGTPVYVTDVATLDASASELAAAFPDPWLRQYSLKANGVPAIVARLGARGLGANVVSRGEWALARRAGIPNARTSLEGIGKSPADLRAAVAAARDGDPLIWIAVESVEEAAATGRLARRAGLGRSGRVALDVLLRLNPDVVPETQAGLAVGAGTSKFGLTERGVGEAVEAGGGNGGALRWRGLQVHIGSQLRAIDAWRDGVRRGLALLALLGGTIEAFDTLDVGGGFPVVPGGELAPTPARFARELPALIEGIPADRRPRRLVVEPGRFLVARAGWLLARVLHVQLRGGPVAVIDAGMTELIRPALYGARHPVVALTSLGRPIDPGEAGRRTELTRVDGPICESTDTFGLHELPALRRGDLVAIADAGAYAASIASAYNGRPRPAQVLLEPDGSLILGRRRGSLRSLW
ncbi:MAG TPA: hypothetical protein VIV06_03330 [Candidatus Limnocylindrales bacterium]